MLNLKHQALLTSLKYRTNNIFGIQTKASKLSSKDRYMVRIVWSIQGSEAVEKARLALYLVTELFHQTEIISLLQLSHLPVYSDYISSGWILGGAIRFY